MTFWKNEASALGPPENTKTATKINAANLEAITAGVNVKLNGAKGDGSTDDTEAVQAAITKLPTNGGTLVVPYGEYKLSGELVLDGKHSVRLVGFGGLSAGVAPASTFSFTQKTGNLISARSTYGFGMADIAINYTNTEFEGTALNMTHNGEGSLDSAYTVAERCNFGTTSGKQLGLGVDLDKATIFRARDCHFGGYSIAARGMKEAGRYSNVVLFDGCVFVGLGEIPLKNAGEAWTVIGCTFDAPLHNKAAGCYAHDSGVISKTTSFIGNWMGDVAATEGSSTWINWRGLGLTVQGNLFGGHAETSVTALLVPDATSTSICFTGNRGDTLVKGVQLETGVKNYIIGANELSSCTGKKVSVDGGSTDKGEGFLSS